MGPTSYIWLKRDVQARSQVATTSSFLWITERTSTLPGWRRKNPTFFAATRSSAKSLPGILSDSLTHAANDRFAARAERRNDTDRLIAGCELALSPLPHSKGLRHRGSLHARKAAGRVQISALLSDPVRHFARQCCPKALRPIRSVLPQIVGELGRIKSYSSGNCSSTARWGR
jgi:hypothetical protein